MRCSGHSPARYPSALHLPDSLHSPVKIGVTRYRTCSPRPMNISVDEIFKGKHARNIHITGSSDQILFTGVLAGQTKGQ